MLGSQKRPPRHIGDINALMELKFVGISNSIVRRCHKNKHMHVKVK